MKYTNIYNTVLYTHVHLLLAQSGSVEEALVQFALASSQKLVFSFG